MYAIQLRNSVFISFIPLVERAIQEVYMKCKYVEVKQFLKLLKMLENLTLKLKRIHIEYSRRRAIVTIGKLFPVNIRIF